MGFRQLFDRESSTYSYLLWDDATMDGVMIDPVQEQAERDIRLIEELGLRLTHCLETHIHADHITGGGRLRERFGSLIATHRKAAMECADLWLEHGDRIEFGSCGLTALYTPGHTDTDISFLGDERVFTGDILLIRSSGRTDFQSGDAGTAYDSIQAHLFTLPDHFAIYPAHDYNGHARTTVGEERAFNPRLGDGRSREEYIRIMEGLDLDKPAKMDLAVPANLKCGLGSKG